MMRKIAILLSLSALVLTLLFFKPTLTGYVTIDSKISFNAEFDKNIYYAREKIDGLLRITLNDDFDSETNVKINFENEIITMKLVDVLDENGNTYLETEPKIDAVNPTVLKILEFNQNGEQATSFKLPKSAVVNSINMDIEGALVGNDYPAFPAIDFGDDGYLEWQYFGSFKEFFNQSIYPENFDMNTEGTTIMIDDRLSYCEIIDLPYSKDFEVSSKYSLYDASSSGDIKAFIFSYSGTGSNIQAEGGANKCDLPELGTTSNWNSCSINLTNPIKGKYLICLQNTIGTNQKKKVYKISNDKTISTAGYTCPFFVNSGSCQKINTDDFYIKVRAADYNKILNKKSNLAEGKTQYSAVNALNEYLSDCSSDPCAIPIKVSSQSKGKIYLTNILISYKDGNLLKEENNFYDTFILHPYVYKVNGVDLGNYSNYTIDIPLNYFELEVPAIQDEETLELEIEFSPGDKKTFNIIVDKKIDFDGSVERINRIKDNLIEISQDEIVKALGLDSGINQAINSFDDYVARINELDQSNESSADKESELDDIMNEIDSSISNLPKKIYVKNEIDDVVIVGPDDVSQFEDANAVYYVQKGFNVKTNAKVYSINYYSGDSETYTLVNKVIAGSTYNSKVYEVIDPSIASIESINFLGNPSIEYGRVSFGPVNQVSYIINGDIGPAVAELKTVVVPNNLNEQADKFTATCGDGVCTSLEINGVLVPLEDKVVCPADCKGKLALNWNLILPILIVLILLILYIDVYKPRRLFARKLQDYFKSKQDYEKLRDYVHKNVAEKKIEKEKLRKVLIARGWTKEQIDFVFEVVKEIKK
ncbi:MAG TPA: hypothetical protein VJB94_00155 [Candidatus Nanoarchaeia archaeon]|nr:hypothetical protein [Candidatus Nanoarchaeia archaeon]